MAKTGPQFGIQGDEFGTDLPVTEVPEQDLVAERKAAKFSKTAEFKRLKRHLEDRIEYYQVFMPDGRNILGLDTEKLGVEWKVANAIVAEFKMVIGFYERANEVVDAAELPGE